MLLTAVATVLVACAAAPALNRALGRTAGWALAVPLLIAAAIVGTAAASGEVITESLAWMPTLGIEFALRLDGLALVFAMLVLVIGAAILTYSGRYLGRGKHGVFYLLMTAFAAAMLVLVLTDDLVVLFVAWEATTLCSFFLIARPGGAARESAIRTVLVTAAGGLALLAAVVTVAIGTGTTRIGEALSHPIWGEDAGFTTSVAILIAIAAFTKSAQFPFHAWLPDSMVAITPVSAYLHAAAMVKAGIYLLLRFSPALAGEQVWTLMLVTAGLITALLGAIAALRRDDLKELLAYSTISQLGLLVAMIGIGTPEALTAAVVHTVAHALFKASLFMLVGVIDHEAGTRRISHLADLQPRMPVTATAIALAAASMAGVPLLLGFVSKETMLEAFLHAPGPAWVPWVVTGAAAAASVLTFAYSGRIVLGALGGRTGRVVREASPLLWGVPATGALAGLALGVAPFLLDGLVSGGASGAAGEEIDKHLALWHGFNAPLAVSAAVIATGTVLILARTRVSRVLEPLAFPFRALDVVDATRHGVVRGGAAVARWAGTASPRRHLAIPAIVLTALAIGAAFRLDGLPPVIGETSRPLDWALVVLVAGGVVAMVRARTRIAAVVVAGVVGFAMTLWFLALGAVDVAITQLLVEILTVTVFVLLLRRLPSRFVRERGRPRIAAGVVAVGAGVATVLGVWALTGRRELSPAATYLLTEGEAETGGANIVNTVLVEFRALDTLGELTVLGMAGLTIAALLHSRRAVPVRSAHIDESSPLADARSNTVFVRTVARILAPLIVVMSVVLLLRGHQEPGGGFIAALVGGAGFALAYMAAPSDATARIRWPYLTLIGAGIVVGAGAGFVGYLDGSFLAPMSTYILGYKLTSSLVFDVGVYLAVIGVILAAYNLLGRQHRLPRDRQREEVGAR